MKYRLGDLIQLSDEKNDRNIFKEKDVRGISNKKEFIETKANLYEVSLKPYLLVKPDYFSYVTITSRNGNKISIAHNTTNETYLVSSSYIVFYIKEPKILLSDYLFMIFNRTEFDRESRYNSWGSAREAFSWNDMCDIILDLPPTEIQQKYVDIYNSLLNNQQAFERGTEDLKLICDAYIEKLRKKMKCERIGNYLKKVDEKNADNKIKLEQGINIEKKFITPQRSNSNLKSRVIVRKNQFAYCTQLNNENVAIAYREGEDCVVSPVYDVFENINKDILLDKYLFLFFLRPEFGRYMYWLSEGTSYEFLKYENLCSIEIPIPSLEIQQDIVSIYEVYNKRKSIAEKLKEQIKNICPVLIAGAIKEGEKANG